MKTETYKNLEWNGWDYAIYTDEEKTLVDQLEVRPKRNGTYVVSLHETNNLTGMERGKTELTTLKFKNGKWLYDTSLYRYSYVSYIHKNVKTVRWEKAKNLTISIVISLLILSLFVYLLSYIFSSISYALGL